MRLVLLPGLLAAGIGSLISIGMGSWTGLSSSAYALVGVAVARLRHHRTSANFGWTIVLGILVAAGGQLIMRGGRRDLPASSSGGRWLRCPWWRC